MNEYTVQGTSQRKMRGRGVEEVKIRKTFDMQKVHKPTQTWLSQDSTLGSTNTFYFRIGDTRIVLLSLNIRLYLTQQGTLVIYNKVWS